MAVVTRKVKQDFLRNRTKSLPDPAMKKAKEERDGKKDSWNFAVRHTFIEVPDPEGDKKAGPRKRASSSPPVIVRLLAQAAAEPAAPPEPEAPETRTTVVIRGMPHAVTRDMLLQVLDSQGFTAAYDFVYLPIEFNKGTNFGYSFVNFVGTEQARRFIEQCQGFNNWGVEHETGANVVWSSLQHFDAHVERYRNSPVMHPTVADDCKPVVFQNGVRVDFPAPTQKVQALRRLRTQRGTMKQLRWEENDQGAPCLNIEKCKKRDNAKAKKAKKGGANAGANANAGASSAPHRVDADPQGVKLREMAMPMYAGEPRKSEIYHSGTELTGMFESGMGSPTASRGIFSMNTADESFPLSSFGGLARSVTLPVSWDAAIDAALDKSIRSHPPTADFRREIKAPTTLQPPGFVDFSGSSDTSYFERRQWQEPRDIRERMYGYGLSVDTFSSPKQSISHSKSASSGDSIGPSFLRTPDLTPAAGTAGIVFERHPSDGSDPVSPSPFFFRKKSTGTAPAADGNGRFFRGQAEDECSSPAFISSVPAPLAEGGPA